MTILNNMKIRITPLKSQSVNSLNVKLDHMTSPQKLVINSTIKKFPSLFSEPNEKLTYTPQVVGEIRTNLDSPVYS